MTEQGCQYKPLSKPYREVGDKADVKRCRETKLFRHISEDMTGYRERCGSYEEFISLPFTAKEVAVIDSGE